MLKKRVDKISFYVITHNEQNNILSCLNSVKDVADEIILVDSFSEDKTVEIAKKFGAKVYLKKYEYSQSDQRNYALSKTKFNWILTIDADEKLSPQLKGKIRHLASKHKYEGYWFSRRHYLDKNKYLKHGYFYPDYQLRLFKKNDTRYSGRLHENLNIPNNKTTYEKLDIYHYAKNPKYHSIKSVLNLSWYIEMQSKEYLDLNRSFFYYFLQSFFSLPYHFIGSFIRGQGYQDGIDGLRAAFVFSFLLSSAYFKAGLIKIDFIKGQSVSKF